MTRKQIAKALDQVSIPYVGLTSQRVEILGYDEDGDFCRETAEENALAAMDITGWGGFATGSGSWVLDRKMRAPAGDYNDRASEHHY